MESQEAGGGQRPRLRLQNRRRRFEQYNLGGDSKSWELICQIGKANSEDREPEVDRGVVWPNIANETGLFREAISLWQNEGQLCEQDSACQSPQKY